MTHRTLGSTDKGRESHSTSEMLEFFMKNDREYTSTELQKAEMLYEARHDKNKYIDSKNYFKEIINSNIHMGSENAKYIERTRKYFLTADGRAAYTPTKVEQKKSA